MKELKMEDRFPILIKVRELNISRKGEGRPLLNISLKISAYLAKE